MTSLVVTTNIKTVKHASWYVSETKNNRKRKHNVNIGQRERERERGTCTVYKLSHQK